MKLIFSILGVVPIFVIAQTVAIGTTTPHASAMLDISSSSKGLLIPRVDLQNPNLAFPIESPAPGLMVYNTNTTANLYPGFYYWTVSGKWERFITTDNGNVPKNAIIQFETKGNVPGFSYVGYTIEDYFNLIGTGTGSWVTLPAYPHADNVIGPSYTFFNNRFYVWSGEDNTYASFPNTGAYLDLTTNSWTNMPTTNAPAGRFDHTTVTNYANGYMYVWGGNTSLGGAGTIPQPTNTGGEYDLLFNTWRLLPASPLAARINHSAIWFQNKMYIWGGTNGTGTFYANGAIYNRTTNTWTTMASSPLSARRGHTAVWTGSRMIVFGGYNGSTIFSDGAAYDPATDTWSAIANNTQFSGAVYDHTATWTGTQMLVFGGINSFGTTSAGSIYNPATNTWSSAAGAPGGGAAAATFADHTAVWTGTELIVVGGKNSFVDLRLVRAYNPATNNWRFLNELPQAMVQPAAVWTGDKLLVQSGSWLHRTGYEFNPAGGTPADIHVSLKRIFYKYKKD